MRPLQARKRQWATPSAPRQRPEPVKDGLQDVFCSVSAREEWVYPGEKTSWQHRCRGERQLPEAWSKRSLGTVPKQKRRKYPQRKTTPLIQQYPPCCRQAHRLLPTALAHTTVLDPLRGDSRGGIALWMHQPNALPFQRVGTTRKPVQVQKGSPTLVFNSRNDRQKTRGKAIQRGYGWGC